MIASWTTPMNVCSNSNRWSAKAFRPDDMYLYGFRNIMSIPDLFSIFLLMFASRPSNKDWTYISEVYITIWLGIDSRWEHAHLYECLSLVNSMNYNPVIQSLIVCCRHLSHLISISWGSNSILTSWPSLLATPGQACDQQQLSAVRMGSRSLPEYVLCLMQLNLNLALCGFYSISWVLSHPTCYVLLLYWRRFRAYISQVRRVSGSHLIYSADRHRQTSFSYRWYHGQYVIHYTKYFYSWFTWPKMLPSTMNTLLVYFI